MAATSSSDLSPHPPSPSSLNASSLAIYECFEIVVTSHIFTAFSCFCVLFFLPLCIFILHLGLQQWRRQRSASATTPSSSDIFTYHIVAIETIGVLGSCIFCSGFYTDTPQMMLAGMYFFNIVTPGGMLFHILTCVERYLAVTHPVFYLGLRDAGRVRIRNISTGFAWVVSFAWMGLTPLYSPNFPTIPFAILLAFSIVVTSFCSLSVLRALIRPGPGEASRDRVDLVKRRAFNTITAITGALLLRFVGQLLCTLVGVFAAMSYRDKCVAMISGIWFAVPSSYVLPLLFLHRAGKLPCFKYDTESGRGSK